LVATISEIDVGAEVIYFPVKIGCYGYAVKVYL
jgi:hypothetical protein